MKIRTKTLPAKGVSDRNKKRNFFIIENILYLCLYQILLLKTPGTLWNKRQKEWGIKFTRRKMSSKTTEQSAKELTETEAASPWTHRSAPGPLRVCYGFQFSTFMGPPNE